MVSDIFSQGEVTGHECSKAEFLSCPLPLSWTGTWRFGKRNCPLEQSTAMASGGSAIQHVHVWQVLATGGEKGLSCNGMSTRGFQFHQSKPLKPYIINVTMMYK